jgi:hypothetical protein
MIQLAKLWFRRIKALINDAAKEKRMLAMSQQMRLDTRAAIGAVIEAKAKMQADCTHRHADGFTHHVYILPNEGERYLICQKCQGQTFASDPRFSDYFARTPNGQEYQSVPTTAAVIDPPRKLTRKETLRIAGRREKQVRLQAKKNLIEDKLNLLPLPELKDLLTGPPAALKKYLRVTKLPEVA